jgi:transcriptional regulator with XRE-family HTH domain
MARGVAFTEALREAWVAKNPGKRYSDAALARDAGIVGITIRRWREGSIPDLTTLIMVSNAVDINVLDALISLQGHSVRSRQPDIAEAIKEQAAAIWALVETVAPAPESRLEQAAREGARLGQERRAGTDRRKPVRSPRRPRRGTGAGP